MPRKSGSCQTSWVIIVETLCACHDVLILGKSPIKWRLRPDMTISHCWALRKLGHELYRDFLAVKIENLNRNVLIFFLILAPDKDCGYTLEPPRRGGSNGYPQCMFCSKNKKNRYTPANPRFSIKVGFKGVYFSWTCFPDVLAKMH